jgi:hypothetical protein
VRAKSWL